LYVCLSIEEVLNKSIVPYAFALMREDKLLDYVTKSFWHETIRLYYAKNDATLVIKKCMENISDTSSLGLAIECGEEALTMEEKTRTKLKNLLEKGIEDKNPAMRRVITFFITLFTYKTVSLFLCPRTLVRTLRPPRLCDKTPFSFLLLVLFHSCPVYKIDNCYNEPDKGNVD
jgi:hypothetical protein